MIRRYFFMRQKWIVATLFGMAWSLLNFETPWDKICFGLGAIWLFIHRKRPVTWNEGMRNDGEIILAPIDGEVVKISSYFDDEDKCNYTAIRINMSHYHAWGLYLPFTSEMAYLKEREGSKRFPRSELATLSNLELKEMSRTDLVLKSPAGLTSHMRFIQCVNGRSPRIWMKSGDHGRGGACFGYYPFGGSLLVFVPENSDILVVENERIRAGESVLAVSRTRQEEIHGV